MKKLLLLSLCLALFITATNAQWVSNGPTGVTSNVSSLVASGNKIFAGTMADGIFVSTDTGLTWQAVDSGLINKIVMSLTASGGNLFAGSNGHAYISTNEGVSWSAVDSGLQATSHVIYSLASIGSHVFAGIEGGGVYVTTNNGAKWLPVGAGLGTIFPTTMVANDTNLYVASVYGGVYRSTDYGASWTALITDTNVKKYGINGLAVSGHTIYASTNLHGLIFTIDNGAHWLNGNIDPNPDYNVFALATSDSNIYASTQYDSLYQSNSNGAYWSYIGTGLPGGTFVSSLLVADNTVFAGTTNKGVWQYQPPVDTTINTGCQARFTVYKDLTTDHNWYALNQATGTGPLSYHWEWGDGSSASDSATPSHIYSSARYYNVCLTIADSTGCTSTYCDSSTYIFKTNDPGITFNVVYELPVATGVNPVTNNSFAVHIYPNPATDNFMVETTLAGVAAPQLQLFNQAGQLVSTQTLTAAKTSISTGSLPAGVYSLSVKGEQGTVTQKLVLVK